MPRKGAVPPQLRPFLFRKGGRKRVGRAARRVQRTVVQVARRSRRRGGRRFKRSSGPAAIPLIPTILALSPEINVGVKAAQEVAGGATGGAAAETAMVRISRLYGIQPENSAEPYYNVKTNIVAKAAGAATHLLMRKFGMRMRISKRLTLF